VLARVDVFDNEYGLRRDSRCDTDPCDCQYDRYRYERSNEGSPTDRLSIHQFTQLLAFP